MKSSPNIVFILADDLGFGDVRCLNLDRGKIATPHLDQLAAQGMTFTDAHATSSVCTPSRYSALTGRYNWRSHLQSGIHGGVEHGPLISAERLTVAGFLRQHGYDTGCVGKWHLGCNWGRKGDRIDFTLPTTGGPTDVGFDWYFGVPMPGSPPHGFMENDRVMGDPRLNSPSEMLRWGGHEGPLVPGFTFESMLPTLTDRACTFIQEHAAQERPFFLYYSMNAPHAPIIPNKEWLGKSGLGQYADFVMETDAQVGRVLDTIDTSGCAENTLVIFTSDNGCTSVVGTASDLDPESQVSGEVDYRGNKHSGARFEHGKVRELEARGHYPSGVYRGYKADIWDGGHRVPFLVRWPAKIQAMTRCDQLVSLMDLMATCADLHDVTLPDNAGEDSVSLMPLFRGSDLPVRDALVHHSIRGNFAIREGTWKLILCPGSGGWWRPTDQQAREQSLPDVQLYDLSTDFGEWRNLQAKHPEVVARLTSLLKQFVADGRSTPGPKQPNDAPVDIWKRLV